MISPRKLAWSLAQVAAFLLGLLTFFVWAPWQGAISIDQAPVSVAASLPTNCPAVEINHGVYSCFWLGTIASNPVGFGLCTVLLVACFGISLFIAFSGRGFLRR